MSRKQKILVCGDVEGNYKTLFSRVSAINEKSGPFDFLFCVGDFFSDSAKKFDPYKNGSLTVPVPTYILGPNKEAHLPFYDDLSGCEICPNVNYLGKYGILSSSGIKIAYISGVESMSSKADFTFSEKEAKAVREAAYRNRAGSSFTGVDVLLTSEWPRDVAKWDQNVKFKEDDVQGSRVLSELACTLKPRYHFSGLKNIFYERPPYRNCSKGIDGSFESSHTTRFIGLAKIGNIGKNKWLYAANLTPLSDLKNEDVYLKTTDETECPYVSITKRGPESSRQYFYDMNAEDDRRPTKKRKNSNSDKQKKFDDPESCWFCLASSSVEKHLVVSIADSVYLALAKGGLTPYHVMIVPITHHRSQMDLPKSALSEIKKYKSALKKFYEAMDLVPVIFERNYKTSHLQLHIVPVPKRVTKNLKEVFFDFSENLGLELSELPNNTKLKDFVQAGTPYFFLELPTKEKLISLCQKDFPIHFGREVLTSAAILNAPNKANWRDCISTKEEEEKLAQNFRELFESFDEFS